MHDGAVARAAPVRGDLLGPLIRRVHRPGPAYCVMAVRSFAAELIELGRHELGRFDRGHAVEVGHLVERALQRAFRRCAVVADDQIDQRVVEDVHVLQCIDQPADMMIGVLHEGGVDLHLALEGGLELRVHLVPRRNLLVPRRELCVSGDHAQFLLALENDLALLVPAVRELALVLLDPLLRYVMRGMRRARREVDEEGLVGQQRFLLARPGDGFVTQIFRQVITLGRRLRRFDRGRAFVQGRIPLIVLAADEPVEIFEPAAARRPCVERSRRAGLPNGDLVALAELRGRVAVELECRRQRRLGVRQHGVVARRCGRDLGDATHADRVMIAAGKQRLPRRRAQRSGVEARVLQAAFGELLEVRGLTRTAEDARCAVADVVDENDENIRRTLRRPQVADRRKLRVRILRVIGDQPRMLNVGNRQLRAGDVVSATHALLQ